MVDEYQDTNLAQFKLVSLLASKYRTCVVGMTTIHLSGSGADIKNILSLRRCFGAKVIKLEQNYRVHQNILNVQPTALYANRGRKDKTPWTANGEGI